MRQLLFSEYATRIFQFCRKALPQAQVGKAQRITDAANGRSHSEVLASNSQDSAGRRNDEKADSRENHC
jgi:hypothetical protein